MSEYRNVATGAHHPQLGFLVTGGFKNHTLHAMSKTEISKDGRIFSAYTPLPIGVLRPCLVALDGDDGEFFLAGGNLRIYSSPINRAFIHRGGQ